MNLLIVRHGSRDESSGFADSGLTEHGLHQIRSLGRALRLRETQIDCFLSSQSRHAQETAEVLRQDLGARSTPIHVLGPLTPHGGPGDVATLVESAKASVPDLERRLGLVLVGHEGRLSDLVAELSGTRDRPLGHGEAICLEATCLADLIAGRGKVRYRYPTFDHQEEQLRPKVQSKMTVSTFLAGFVFTALSGLLLLAPDRWAVEQILAAVALTCSLAMFIACVYIYDQLGMPSGFWTDASAPRMGAQFYRRAERRREARWLAIAEAQGKDAADEDLRPWLQDGPRYHLMISTSRRLFTPATWLSFAGFLALLKGTGDTRIFVGACIGLLLAACYAVTRRPDLGAD